MHKRRQVADANPKNLTHFSGNSHSSSSLSQATSPTAGANTDFRPMKSIIIGAGQPIIVPGQRNATNETVGLRTSTNSAQNTIAATAPTTAKSSSNALSSSHVNSIHDLSHVSIADGKVVSVEEFCPDGGALDKSFLDDLPLSASSNARHTDPADSDSDGGETGGNPLVAKFHEDPGEYLPVESVTKPIQTTPKVNPLAKGKNKSTMQMNLSTDTIVKRRSSLSSDDIEMPTVLKTISDNNSSGGLSNEEFDSWLSDTNQRRSPEGGEDVASLPSIDKTTAPDPETTSNNEIPSSTQSSEKKHKSKKKKKDKKEKHDREDKVKKKSHRSKKSELEDFLTGNASTTNRGTESVAVDEAYEAL